MDQFSEALARQLYWDGAASGGIWPHAKAVHDHLKKCPVYKGHVVAQGDKIERTWEETEGLETLSHKMEDVIAAPHFLEFALSYTDLAEAVLGEFPYLYSLNAFWTRPGHWALDPNIQNWHRDRDDRKFLVLFLFGTDVGDDGAHLFAKGTHRDPPNSPHGLPPNAKIAEFSGPRGTYFFAQTFGVHMGRKPQHRERLLGWVRWCVSEKPQSYVWDGLKPIAPPEGVTATDKQKRSSQLVVAW